VCSSNGSLEFNLADVFISYKSDRRATAEYFAEILRDHGYCSWWDYELLTGRDFSAQIETQLKASKAVIVLWCSLSRVSEWVKEEAEFAKTSDKLIPVLLEPIELPLGFRLSQTLDLSGWDGSPLSSSLDRLLREVARLTGSPPIQNLDGLKKTERAWRRFGSKKVVEFSLVTPFERERAPPTTPDQLASAESDVSHAGYRKSETVLPPMSLGAFYKQVRECLKTDDAIWRRVLGVKLPKNTTRFKVAARIEREEIFPNHDKLVGLIERNWQLVEDDDELVVLLKAYIAHVKVYRAIRAEGDARTFPITLGAPWPDRLAPAIESRLRNIGQAES
jgi:hypothetical protein